MGKSGLFSTLLPVAAVLVSCLAVNSTVSAMSANDGESEAKRLHDQKKPVVYQVFTRLFGNTNATNKPWGTLAENGVGKFNDFTPKALSGIRELGVSHIWYTGVLHHALVGDYKAIGVSDDDPDVIKGRAGSPYAVKDYYSVNPDLAEDPKNRLQEFEALIARTHAAGMKVIIDIVPNHVARGYQSIAKPKRVGSSGEPVLDFGERDNTRVQYDRHNDFYYVPDRHFEVPDFRQAEKPLGGERHPLVDGKFFERPAKWTGNGSRSHRPAADDWYETVKINYGVKPDGSKDFPVIPQEYWQHGAGTSFGFWKGLEHSDKIPASWKKMRDIAFFWLDKGVDGFRYDVAELVPVEFWNYLNSAIKEKKSDAFLLAEVYDRKRYREYIHIGLMDYLYNKSELYDALRAVMQGEEKPVSIDSAVQEVADIDKHMLTFLENHDEQRLASDAFMGNANKARSGMGVTATIGQGPLMIYFGQELGEKADQDLGFGKATRTTIFDYASVPSVRRWVNEKRFDGGSSTAVERDLRDYYKKLMNYAAQSEVLQGDISLLSSYCPDSLYCFTRYSENTWLLVISSFGNEPLHDVALKFPAKLNEQWQVADGEHVLLNPLTNAKVIMGVVDGEASLTVDVPAFDSVLLELKRP